MKFDNSIYMPNPSGRQGSTVFSKNKAGLYSKMFVKPTNPRTPYQVLLRILFTNLTRSWASLTSVQRQGWNNLMSYFPKMSGFNIYVSLNRNLQDIGEPILADAPVIDTMLYGNIADTFSVDVDLTVGSEDIKLNFSPVIPATQKVKVYATAMLKPSVKVNYKKLTIIGTIDSTFLTGSSIKNMYLAKFGTMPTVNSLTAFGIQPVVIATGLANVRRETTAIGTV